MSGFIKGRINNQRIIFTYYFNIVLLLIYSTYKNGTLLFNKNLIGFGTILRPCLIVLGSILITYIVDYFSFKYVSKKDHIKELLLNDYNPVFIGLITLSMPININIILYFMAIIIFDFLNNKVKKEFLNSYALFKIIIILLMVLLHNYLYENIYELNADMALTTLDMFLGRSIGGIGTTSTLLIVVCYLNFLTIPSYKKEIPIIAFLTYLMLIILSCLFNYNFISEMKIILNSEFIFGLVFIATIPYYSPIINKDKYIYSLLIGIFSFIFNKIVNPYEGVFIGIILSNLILYLLNRRQILKMRYNTLGKRGTI
jgi:Na+-translocating ferredoxin:NAD+ oxidoreductase RnfD subunit